MTVTAPQLLTEHCRRSPIPGGCHCWLRSVIPTGPATCAWCARSADPVADLGDPPPAVRLRRQRAEAEASGDLFAEAPT